ncbi:MAG: 5'-3' exonuclease H3TH domain-containing protein, partial [Flavobacteriales bacterium]
FPVAITPVSGELPFLDQEDVESPEAFRRIIEALRIPVLECDGYEADDVIGTLAKKAESEGYTTFMVTPDKDFGQLVTDRIIMYKPGRGGDPPEKLGPKEVRERWGIESPDQVRDILGLMGDAVDNIPGIPGIGEKTATKLIQQFGSLEAVLENVDQLKGKLKENLVLHAEQGRLSKQLATINVNAPVALDHGALHLDPPDREKVLEVFGELEFKTLAGRVLGGDGDGTPPRPGAKPRKPASGAGQADLFEGAADEETPADATWLATIDSVPHRYFLAEGSAAQHMLAAQLKKQPRFCFDTKTTGTDERTAELVGLAFDVMLRNLEAEQEHVRLDSAVEAEQRINALRDQLRLKHYRTMEEGGYNVRSGLVYHDLFSSLEKVGDHLINVSEELAGEG